MAPDIEVAAARSRAAMDAVGILPEFAGVLVHDANPTYDSYKNAAGHQLCAAHLLRELQAVADHHAQANPGRWCWAQDCAQAIRSAITDHGQGGQARQQITQTLARPDQDLNHPDGKLGGKHRALARRIERRLDDYLRFTHTPGVPPTNNPAEQEIRVFKLKQKVSGGMRTLQGARNFALIRSYLSTARKHNTPPLQAITTLHNPHQPTWLPPTHPE